MRAEMTVGLDLKSLENLRIYNGYEKEKNTRRLSFEAPSSPESDVSHQDSNSTQGNHHKSKCGRPANPIPRHKRDSHIKAEYKRRDKIQKGFDSLISLVPELSEVSASKSTMLFKTAEHCRRLDSERGNTQKELAALRQELEALGSEIQVLQEKLPCHGVKTTKDKHDEVTMDTLYDQYVREETKKNWKFWIFGYFMRPLYESFRQSVDGKHDREEFESSTSMWVQNKLSLTNLRKGFLDALRGISKYTSIMTNPEKLESESKTRISEHFATAVQNSTATIPVPTPPGTPHLPSPMTSAARTPATTPATSPPRTPNVSRRSSRHENNQKSTENRSRSNSPEEVRIKRRSSYRSRSGKRSPGTSFRDEKDTVVDYYSMNPGTKMPLLSHLLTSPKANVIGPVEPVVRVTKADNRTSATYSSQSGSRSVPSQPHSPVTAYSPGAASPSVPGGASASDTATNHSHGGSNSYNQSVSPTVPRNHDNQDEKSKQLTTFIESLFSEKQHMELTIPEPSNHDQARSNTRTSPVIPSAQLPTNFMSDQLDYHASPHHSVNITTSHNLQLYHSINTTASNDMDMCHLGQATNSENDLDISVSSSQQLLSGFVPLNTSGIISNNLLVQDNEPNVSISELLPMEISVPLESNSDLLLNSLQMFTSESEQVPMSTYSHSALSASSSSTGLNNVVRSDILNTDEDSLTCNLGMDVLDMNSVFTFFDSDKSHS